MRCAPTRCEITCDDGVVLHAEVDEVTPYAEGKRRRSATSPTLVFVHGYALNLDCWHFQREAFRGKHRMAFYDQRSHGRSERSDREHATIDQLGDDLASVIEEVAPKGDVVLVGHSMGGMSIIALAERHPELFAKRVKGVALISTTAGGLRPHRTLSRWIPDRLGTAGGAARDRCAGEGARAGRLGPSLRVEHRLPRRRHVRVRQQGRARPREVEFLDEMLAGTSFDVLAEFFPNFSELDKFDHLGALGQDADHDHLRHQGQAHLDRAQPQDGRSACPNATLVECEGAGHMVIFEARDQVNAALEDLVEAAST